MILCSGVSTDRIIGLIFFEDTVNSAFFWHDSATAYTARASMDTLLEVFRYRSISSGLWPACYPIFSLCYFCLWGPQGKTF